MYNSQETIGKCLDSIYNSDYPRDMYEVIVVDDCSTDNSIDVVNKYSCKLTKLTRNRGPAVARNIGAKKSTGNILVFIDSDVVIDPGSFNLTINSFDKRIACLTAMNARGTNYNFSTDFFNLLDHFTFLKSPQYVVVPCTSYLAIKNDVFQDLGGFNENYRRACVEDVELGMRLVNKRHKIYLNKKLKFIHLKRHTFLSSLKN